DTNFNWLEANAGAENSQPHDATNADIAELFGVDFPSDGSEEAIDLFQDFGKIGQTKPAAASSNAANRANGSPVKRSTMAPPPPKPAARPGLNRSSTSRW
ncbi:hypothetical protein KC352_g28434, partial [Hortaea werneckii]